VQNGGAFRSKDKKEGVQAVCIGGVGAALGSQGRVISGSVCDSWPTRAAQRRGIGGTWSTLRQLS